MPSPQPYTTDAPTREEVDALPGLTLIEFGTDWCGHCRAAQPLIATSLLGQPDIRYLKIEDGPGRRLGRSFKVKLWPTLIFMKDGEEVDRLVRPTDAADLRTILNKLSP